MLGVVVTVAGREGGVGATGVVVRVSGVTGRAVVVGVTDGMVDVPSVVGRAVGVEVVAGLVGVTGVAGSAVVASVRGVALRVTGVVVSATPGLGAAWLKPIAVLEERTRRRTARDTATIVLLCVAVRPQRRKLAITMNPLQ